MTTRLLALVAAIYFVIGCSSDPSSTTDGAPITDSQLCYFRYGLTTLDDVSRLLGPPTSSGIASSVTYIIYDRGDAAVHDMVTFAFQGGYLSEVERTTTGTGAIASVPECLKFPGLQGAP